MNKKITSSVLAAVMIAGSTSFSALAAMANGTVVIGTKAFDLAYANNPANAAEITNAVVAANGAIFVKDFEGNWINNATGLKVLASVIPAVTYKSATGVVSSFDAADKDAVAVVDSITVVSANEIKVTSTKEFAATATFVVKLGLVPQDVTVKLSEDKKSAILTSENNFVAGDYTVVVNGVEKTLKVEAQKLSSFVIKTERLTAVASQDVVIEALNQYGKVFDVASSNFTATAFDITNGNIVSISANGNNKFTLGAVALDKNILVTITQTSTGLSQTKTFKVVSASTVDTMTFGVPVPKANTARIFVSDATDALILPLTLLNQYGSAKDLTANLFDGVGIDDEIKFISSNNSIVDPANFEVNTDKKLTYNTGSVAGKVTITAIATKTGKTASVTFEVFAAPSIKTVTLQQPSGLVVTDEDTTIAYTATNSLGDAYKLANVNDVVWFSSNPLIVNTTSDLAVDSKGVLTVTPQASGTVTLSSFIGGVKQSEITLDVKEVAVATKITKMADAAITSFNKNAGVYTYAAKDLAVVDQYNREILTADLTGTVTVAVKDATTDVVTASGAAVTAANDKVGTKVLTVTYGGTITRDFTVTVVNEADVVNYTLAAISNTLLRSDAGFTTATLAGSYARTFVINNGLTATGVKVALKATDASDFMLTTTSNEVVIEGAKVYAAVGSNDKTATVAAWKKGSKISEVTFTTKSAAPVLSTLGFDATSYTVATTLNVAAKLTVIKDQYGVVIALPAGTWFSSNNAIATVVSGVVTKVAAGETTVTFVAANGVFATAKIVVE